jgi:hypothetical protein
MQHSNVSKKLLDKIATKHMQKSSIGKHLVPIPVAGSNLEELHQRNDPAEREVN